MNKKGFTLVELLAVISILSIILLIAVPNVISIIDRNRKETYIEDAKRFVSLVEYKLGSDPSLVLPTSTSSIVIVKLSFLEDTELDVDPEGNTYSDSKSFVAIRLVDSTYHYYVTLVGEDNSGNITRGVELVASTSLNNTKRTNFVQKDLPDYLVDNAKLFEVVGAGNITKVYGD